MSTQSPYNATQSLQDSPSEAADSHKETDSLSGTQDSPNAQPQEAISTGSQNKPQDALTPSYPPRTRKLDKIGQVLGKKRKRRKKKGKARKVGKAVSSKPLPTPTLPENKSQSLPSIATEIQSQVGEEGIRATGPDQIGLHPVTNKNLDQKGPALEAQPIEGVEDVLGEGPIEEVETRAAAYAKVKAVWEKAGDVCVRVYARPLNPRLVLVEWEGEDGVEKHGKIVVGERQRGMFGPGKVVWVRGPLVGDRWLLAGKYNFLGNRVS